ncbi:glutaminyl-peptide cyclotransferase [Flavobacterium sp. CYK-4]|uniref:glutaminyl-peptide cyclotransferase n=1 Tax=Flavobacterium lotistagni TaxID=2709660 RepID=UPI00140A733F|nr:glutaminyl-peptide cyclotransferase [Flavobacterium lotistagni]NHM08221.1 glutaminyl-peptide cyclotransferase [Flavobacterium lotistagni]
MKKRNLLSAIVLTSLLVACVDKKNDENLFSFNTSAFREMMHPEESVNLEIQNPQNKVIDSIIYYVNDEKVGAKKGAEKLLLPLADKKLGYQNLKALVYYEGENTEITARIEVFPTTEPKFLNYTVVNSFPHDTLAFTEGFEFFRDTLIESTGQKGLSHFRKYDYKTGKIFKQVNLENEYFGEGITVINNKIYQLTWQSNVGFVYDANSLKKLKTFPYDKKIEGWGMTNDGKNIYQSDGTEKIWTMDPETQKMTNYINVYTNSSKIKSINELEWIDGKIYGNIWQKDAIAVINPATGAVEGVLNLADLRKQVKNATAEVLNGIAYNPKTKTIFVTGKNWDKMFEIRVK